MYYFLSVERERVLYPKTLEALCFENYEADNGYTFESEYFCDIEERADCLVEMGIDFQMVELPDYYMTVSRIVYNKDGYLAYKENYNKPR